jgi:hypothetical protein
MQAQGMAGTGRDATGEQAALKMQRMEREALRWNAAHARAWAQLMPEGFVRGYLDEIAEDIATTLAELDGTVEWRDDAGRRVIGPPSMT